MSYDLVTIYYNPKIVKKVNNTPTYFSLIQLGWRKDEIYFIPHQPIIWDQFYSILVIYFIDIIGAIVE